MEKNLMNFEHRWKLRDWIDESKLHYPFFLDKSTAIRLLSNRVNIETEIDLFKNNLNKINWRRLFGNPNAYHLIEPIIIKYIHNKNNPLKDYENENENETSLFFLLPYMPYLLPHLSKNPNAIHLLEKYPEIINWEFLSSNPSAIHLLEKNQNNINWFYLSSNSSAIHLLEQNINASRDGNFIPQVCKIDWNQLSLNLSAIHILEQNPDKINWDFLSSNPSAIHLLQNNQDKINWSNFSENPAIFELDYDFFKRRMDIIRQELLNKVWNPEKVLNL